MTTTGEGALTESVSDTSAARSRDHFGFDLAAAVRFYAGQLEAEAGGASVAEVEEPSAGEGDARRARAQHCAEVARTLRQLLDYDDPLVDTASSVSVQHYFDTGRYLPVGKVL